MDRYESYEADNRRDKGASLAVALLGGAALGALAMYLADPEQGRRRRVLAAEAMRNMTERTGGAVSAVWSEASSRLFGRQEGATRLTGARSVKPIDDHVLEARVRSKLSRLVTNANAIDIVADQGRVTLSGPVVEQERDAVLELVQAIPGVESVRASLDDGGRMQAQWSGVSLLALAGGVLLGYYGLTRRGGSGIATIGAGINWLSRNVRGFELLRLFGATGESGAAKPASGNEPAVTERAVDIKPSPDDVFDVWNKGQMLH